MYFNIILSPTLRYSKQSLSLSLSLSLSQVFRPKRCTVRTLQCSHPHRAYSLYLIAITIFPEGHKLTNSVEYRVLLEKLSWSGNSLHFMQPQCSLPRYSSQPTVLTLIQIHPDHAPSPQSYFLKSILILSSHLRLSLTSGRWPPRFSTKT